MHFRLGILCLHNDDPCPRPPRLPDARPAVSPGRMHPGDGLYPVPHDDQLPVRRVAPGNKT